MYRTTERTQKRKDQKRRLLLDTAAKVFSEKGYHNTTVKDIVKEAGASVGCFYFYFESKEDLFLELYKRIVEEFHDATVRVLDVANYSMLKNFTRVMTATLWMYSQKREIARMILLDAATADPAFQRIESKRMLEFARTMADWFKRFQVHSAVHIPDERVAALMYAGTYNCLINDWLTSGTSVPLTAYSYAFCVYNLQALQIPFDETVIRAYIAEVLDELSAQSRKQEAQYKEEGETDE